MPGPLTDTKQVSAAVTSFFSESLLRRARPKTVHNLIAQRRPLAARKGNTIVFRRYERLALAKTPLVEGVTPTGSQIDKTDVSSAIVSHGNYQTITDLVEATVDSPILREATRLNAQNMAETVDSLHADDYSGGTNVDYGGTATQRSDLTTTTHKITTALLNRAIRTLQGNDADFFTEMISAANRDNTYGILPSYWGIMHPDVAFTARTLTGWRETSEYPSSTPIHPAEIGSFRNIRFLQSTQAKVLAGGGGSASGDVKSTSSNADVYITLVAGMDAVGTVPFDQLSVANIIHPRGTAGPADPLNQRGTSAWKRTGTQLILNENFIVRLETTAGDAAP